jgi:S-formylglutathione hydrolase
VKTVSQSRCFGGVQGFHSHDSAELGCAMRFAAYVPPQAANARVPVVYWLSGLTCTDENFTTKAGAQRVAAELGLAIVVCDTSPRGLGIAGESESWDLGLGAGFYVDATREPWSHGYRMYSYVTRELPALVNANFPVDARRVSICGHSMGGHGALVIALRNPAAYRSVSAFAPIASATRCPWGRKALAAYLGDESPAWLEYDAAELLAARGWNGPPILVDQGTQDSFLEAQLKPELLVEASRRSHAAIDLRMQQGYDHSYYFIATFIEDHLRFHARALNAEARAAATAD